MPQRLLTGAENSHQTLLKMSVKMIATNQCIMVWLLFKGGYTIKGVAFNQVNTILLPCKHAIGYTTDSSHRACNTVILDWYYTISLLIVILLNVL